MKLMVLSRSAELTRQALLAGVALMPLVAAPQAYAQTSPATNPAASADQGAVSEVVVTGSRIQSTGYARATPVTVVSAQQLTSAQPAGVAQALVEMPQFANSTTPRAVGSPAAAFAHGNYLNLRNLGSNRSLILQDGVRVPPTTADGQVSVDVIPELLVQRVDVVTGGVSAVYGSDAVAGVVNFILDKKFTGIRGEVTGSVSDRNDMGAYRVGVAGGAGFLQGRGHVLFSVSRDDAGGIALQDRPYSKFRYDAVALYPAGTRLPDGTIAGNLGTASNPYYLRPNVVSSTQTAGSNVQIGPPGVQGIAFTADDSATPYVRDNGQFALLNAQVGGTGSILGQDRTLQTPYRTDQVFGRASFDLTDRVETFIEAQAQKSVYRYGAGDNFGTVPIFAENPYIPASVRAAIIAAPGNVPVNGWPAAVGSCGRGFLPAACLGVQGTFPEDFGRPYQKEINKAFVTRAGLRADLGGSWHFDATYVFGQAELRFTEFNGISQQALYASVDAVRDPTTGAIVCRVALTNPGLYPGCVPWNPFGVRAPSQQLADWMHTFQGRQDSTYKILNVTNDLTANVTGELFHTWAGPIGVAIGGEYRTGLLKQTTNSDPTTLYSKTGIRGILATAPPWIRANTGTARGSNDIWEVNGEIEVPLARDMPLAHSLSVTAAGRYTHYSTSGGVETWKLGGSWAPIEQIRIRVAKSRDIRAPTLFDLYAGRTSTTAAFTDAHCQCRSPNGIAQLGGGNPDLVPEIGKTLTVGAVIQPISRFTLSVDYYKIKLTGALSLLSINQVNQDCEDSGGTSPVCAYITRPLPFSDRSPANVATAIFATRINAAFLTTSGLDFDASYAQPLDELGANGTLNFRLFANYTKELKTQASASSPIISNIGTTDSAQPKWKASLNITYINDPWSVALRIRYIGKLKTGPGTPAVPSVFADPELPDIAYTDATVTHKFKGIGADFEAFATVNNVFDQQPPLFSPAAAPGLFYPTLFNVYDVVGRYYTAGLRFRF